MGSQTFVKGELPQQAAASFQDLIYETTTGYITIAVQNNREWQALIRAVNRPEWAEDPRFLTAELRQKNIDARLDLIQSVIKTDSAEHWLARLQAESVPCAPVLTRTQVLEHPQVLANDLLVEYDHPQAGQIRQTRSPARFSTAPTQPWHGAPALGQDTMAVLADCGYSSDDLQAIIHSGVAGVPEDEQS